MSFFAQRSLDKKKARSELKDFGKLLGEKGQGDLGEAGDVLPFFTASEQLCVLMGLYNFKMSLRDVGIAREFSIFGDHYADLVVGSQASSQYCFFEFEDAKSTSIFRSSAKQTSEWSSRFEHGYSQLIDWILWIENNQGNTAYKTRFGSDFIDYNMILVIGRDRDLVRPDLRERFHWRSESVVVASKKMHCITYDQLHQDLETWLNVLSGK